MMLHFLNTVVANDAPVLLSEDVYRDQTWIAREHNDAARNASDRAHWERRKDFWRLFVVAMIRKAATAPIKRAVVQGPNVHRLGPKPARQGSPA